VKYHRTGRKRLQYPIVRDLDLSYEALELPADPGLRINVYTAEPATPSEDPVKLLASWAADQDRAARVLPDEPGLVTGDLTRPETLGPAVEGVDAIVHPRLHHQ
jgi:hypothetical protein